MSETGPDSTTGPAADFDAIVIGAGHNGLVTAAYLARAGVRTLLLEARADVGGTAASESFAGATVNICNCDHLTFRTTPVIDELGLVALGLEYIDVEPAQNNYSWASAADGRGWSHHHDLDATLDDSRTDFPSQVDGYRRYAKAAMPAVRMVLDAAAEPPTVSGLTRLALRHRLRGAPTLMSWSRRSAADVLRSFFDDDALHGTRSADRADGVGHLAGDAGKRLGCAHPCDPPRRQGRAAGRRKRAGAPGAAGGVRGRRWRAADQSAVDTILCHRDRVSGVALVDGTEITAPIVVSACNPHDTFLKWLKHPPASADDLVRRWSDTPATTRATSRRSTPS